MSPRKSKPSDDETRAIAVAYGAGHPIRRIAADTGRSFGSVRNALIRAEVPLRTRGGNNRSGAGG